MILDTQTAKNVIDNVFQAVKPSHPQEVLQNLHLTQKDGRLYMTGNNNIFQITGSTPVDQEEEVDVLVDAQVFARSLQNASSDEVELDFNKKSVTIKDDRSRTKVSLTPNDGFPFIKFGEARERMVVDAAGLSDSMKACKVSAQDPSKAMLDSVAGVLIDSDDDKAYVKSTNASFIVQRAEVTLKEGSMKGSIIPKQAVDAIVSSLRETDNAELEVGESLQIKGGGYVIRTMPLSGKFPNVDQFFPSDGEDHWMSTSLFQSLVKRAKMQQRNNRIVILSFSEGQLQVGTVKDEVSEFTGDMEYEGQVTEKHFGLESESLMNLLQFIDTSRLIMRTRADEGAKVYLMAENDNPSHIAVLSRTKADHL